MTTQTEKSKPMLGRIQDVFKDAEEGMMGMFRELAERAVNAQSETKRRIDNLLASLPNKDEVGKLAFDNARARVAAVKQDFEVKIEESTELLWDRLGLATKNDIDQILSKVVSLNKRMKELENNLRDALSASKKERVELEDKNEVAKKKLKAKN